MSELDGTPDTGQPAEGGAPAQATPSAGEAAPAWNAGMTAEQLESPALQDFSSMESLAGAYLSAKSMIGRDKIVMPQTDEEFGNVYDRLGRPETAGDYTFSELPEGFDENTVQLMGEDKSWFAEKAHELGLSQSQAEKMFEAYAERTNGAFTTHQANTEIAQEEAVNRISEEWGTSYDTNMDMAERAVMHLGGQELLDALVKTGAGNDTTVLNAFLKMGGMMREEIGVDRSGNEANTSDQIKDQITDLAGSKAYTDATHPDHNRSVQKMLRLNERVHGTNLAM